MKFILLIICLIFTPLFAFANQIIISGSVVDSLTLEPLPYANIYIKDTNIGTASNLEGYFEIKLKTHIPQFQLIIRYMGYKTKILNVNSSQIKQSEILKLSLVSEPILLNEIVVTADYAEQLLKRVYKKLKKEKITNIIQKPFTGILPL